MDRIRKNPLPSGPEDSGIVKPWYVSIVQIIGPVLDVAFPPGKMPKLYNALIVEGIDSMVLPITLGCELLALLGDNRILAIARANLSLYRHIRVGMKVFDKGVFFYTKGLIAEDIYEAMLKGTPPLFRFTAHSPSHWWV